MKIVTLITRLIRGGAQRIALETAAYLTARGQDAPLWCGPETGPEGSLHEEAAARGVRIRIFPDLVRRVDPARDLRAYRSLTRALREESPGRLHTHSSKAGIIGREAARSARVPFIVHTVHGWGFTPETPAILRSVYVALERRETRFTRALLFVNESDRTEGVRLGILLPGSGRIVPPGIDLAKFSCERLASERARIRRQLGWPEEIRVGGFLGRLSPQKDPGCAVEAAARLSATRPDLRWLMVGDGPLAPQLRKQSGTDPRLAGRIAWVGLQSDPVPWLAAMDVLLFPSRWEGLPLTIMESLAAGVPVAASDLPGVRSLLAASPGGEISFEDWLVPCGDPGALASRAAALLDDREGACARSRQARQVAFARFGIERMLETIAKVYEGA